MYVIFRAFNGKLESEVMEWPENVGMSARFPLDMDSEHFFENGGVTGNPPTNVLLQKVGTFKWNGQIVNVPAKYEYGSISEKEKKARIYILTGIN
jgi:hypothetical protein